jgi:hypothetical protein
MICSCYSHRILSLLWLELDASLPRLQDEEHRKVFSTVHEFYDMDSIVSATGFGGRSFILSPVASIPITI